MSAAMTCSLFWVRMIRPPFFGRAYLSWSMGAHRFSHSFGGSHRQPSASLPEKELQRFAFATAASATTRSMPVLLMAV